MLFSLLNDWLSFFVLFSLLNDWLVQLFINGYRSLIMRSFF